MDGETWGMRKDIVPSSIEAINSGGVRSIWSSCDGGEVGDEVGMSGRE